MFLTLAAQAQFNRDYVVKIMPHDSDKTLSASCQVYFDNKGQITGTWTQNNKKFPLQGSCSYRAFKTNNNKGGGSYIMDIYLNDSKGKHLAHITAVDERGDRRKFSGEYITSTDVESDIEMVAK